MLKVLAILSVLSCAWADLAMSQESDLFFETARVRGRGGTYVAQYFGDHSSRFNAATLAETNSSFNFRPLEINSSLGLNVVDTISDLLSNDFGSSDTGAVIEFIRKFEDKFGDRHLGRFEAELFAVRFLNIEIMPFIKNQTFIELRRPTTPQFEYELDSFAGIYIAYGYDFGGKFKVGAALKPMLRTTTSGQLIFTDVLDLENTDIEEFATTTDGTGVGFDLSGLWTPSATFRLGAVVENLGGMGYFDSEGTPEPLRQKSSLGLAWRLPMSGGWDLDLSGDIQHLENPDGIHWARLLHMGADFGTKVYSKETDFGVTAGINDGYGTLGAYADIWVARLEVSKYAVELDRDPGQREDQRYALTLRTSMTF